MKWRDILSVWNKLFKRKAKKGLSREEFLQLKPIKNPLLEWNKSPKGEVVITIRPPEKADKGKWGRFLSKLSPTPPKEKRVNLDKIGSFVWERCDGKHCVAEIVQGLCKEYKITPREAEVSLSKFLQLLAKRKFIGVIAPELKEKEEEESLTLRKIKTP